MLSVIIPTRNSERALVATLAALVRGATAGLVSEVILADGGSTDDTAAVADVAGCRLMAVDAALAGRLKAAAAAARGPWLLFLRPGTVLDLSWTNAVDHFLQSTPSREAAVFRRGAPAPTPWREVVALFNDALGAAPHPDQGLLISKRLYDALGGHCERAADPERDLMRRIGRRRRVRLASAALAGGGQILD